MYKSQQHKFRPKMAPRAYPSGLPSKRNSSETIGCYSQRSLSAKDQPRHSNAVATNRLDAIIAQDKQLEYGADPTLCTLKLSNHDFGTILRISYKPTTPYKLQ
jgi:hypothetical protein